MGCYVNPADQPKELWLLENGKMTESPEIKSDSLPVCLVDNGMFTAAGVAFSPDELAVFQQFDGREKVWFQVPLENLKHVSDVENYL